MELENNQNLSVRERILLIENRTSNKETSPINKSHTLEHDYQNLTYSKEKSNELVTVIKESNEIKETIPKELPPVQEEKTFDESLKKLSEKTETVEQKIFEKKDIETEDEVTDTSTSSSVTSEESSTQSSKTESKVSPNHEKVKANIDSFGKLIQKIADNKGLKLAFVKDEQGRKHLGVGTRGLIGKSGSSQQTMALMVNTLPKMMGDVTRTGDAKLMKQYQEQLTQLKSSPWGRQICKNNPSIRKILDDMLKSLDSAIQKDFDKQMSSLEGFGEMIDLAKEFQGTKNPEKLESFFSKGSREENIEMRNRLEEITKHPGFETLKGTELESQILIAKDRAGIVSSRLSETDLANILMGKKLDETLDNHILETAGWGVPSISELQQSFKSAIETLREQKNRGASIDQEMKSLVFSALQLLERKPPIKNLREQSNDIDFLNNVLEPLAELTEGTELDGVGDELQNLYNSPLSVESKEVQVDYKQDATTFMGKMKEIANGKLSSKERDALLDGMTQDFRMQWSTVLSNIEEGEFDRQGWNKGEKEKTSPNIIQAQKELDQQEVEIVDMVLDNCDKPLKPGQAKLQLEFLCDLLDRAMKDHNYSAIYTIAGSLNSTALYRLINDPRIGVSKQHKAIFEEASRLVSQNKNSATYRKALEESNKKFESGELKNAPIPYLGILQTDLTFISDGNPDNIEDKVNGFKSNLLQKTLGDFKSMQKNLKNDAESSVRLTGFFDVVSTGIKNSEKGISSDERRSEAYQKSRSLLPPQG